MATLRRIKRKRDVALITDASSSRIRNYNYRRHTYAVLQWSRIPLLLACGAVIMWTDLKWLAAILLVVSVPMPWIAVVIANGVGEPEDKRAPRVYKPGVARQEQREWERQQVALHDEKSKQRALPTVISHDDGEVHDNDSTPPDDDASPTSPNDAPDDTRTTEPVVIDMPEDLD